MKRILMLTLLIFAVAAVAGCGKKAPPQPPDTAARSAENPPAPSTT